MFTQFLFCTPTAPGNNVANATIQQAGNLVAVQFMMYPIVTLGAGDEFMAEIELSLNNVISGASQMSPPNGVIAKAQTSTGCDIAGTSIAYLNPCRELVPVTPRRFVAGQIVYVNTAILYSRAGGTGTLTGWINLQFR